MSHPIFGHHFFTGKTYLVLERILKQSLDMVPLGASFEITSGHPGHKLQIQAVPASCLELVKFEPREGGNRPVWRALIQIFRGVKQLHLLRFAMDEILFEHSQCKRDALSDYSMLDICERLLLDSLKELLIHECRAN
jgi:hypothetical protein